MPEGTIPQGVPINPQTSMPYAQINGYSYLCLSLEAKMYYQLSLDRMRPDTYIYIGPTPAKDPAPVSQRMMWSPTVELTKEPRGWERYKQ